MPGTLPPLMAINASAWMSWAPEAGKLARAALENVMSNGTRILCCAAGSAAFSKSISGFCVIVTPGKLANGPVGVGRETFSEANVSWLKPSTTSQNAWSNFPPLALITSCTSSFPKELLSTQNSRVPVGRIQRLSDLLQ